MARLDLGGGLAPTPGHINIDIIPEADIKWDLNKGLPKQMVKKTINDEYVEMMDLRLHGAEGIRCHHLVEHLDTIIPMLNDCYTVMKSGAEMEISTHYFNTIQAAQDPTHKRMGFVSETFLYFAKDSPFEKEQKEYGITARFEVVKAERGQGMDDWQLFVVLRKP